MSSFYYKKNSLYDNEPRLAVRCDGCKAVLFTDVEGQCFPEHITIDARNAGWKHLKESGKWKDYCPECDAYMRQKNREKVFG
jgi:hypothetical protein